MAAIQLRSLAHSYHRQPAGVSDYAIHKMNHVWEQGGAYALLGPSGCGKSTLLNIISGLLSPSEGEVLFDGVKVNDIDTRERNIAQVFQFPVVYDSMTVFDNLAFPLRNQRMAEPEIQKKVSEVADILGLTALLERKAKKLTADEKQKVSMGRGLVRDDVSAILFDEPLTVIDPHLKWQLRRKLKEIHEQFNITMIYVTHDQLEASTFADKIAVMYEGQIVQFGTPRELFESPSHTFVGYFIGSPGMNLMEVSRNSAGLRFGNTTIPINPLLHERLERIGTDNLKMGIRPEFVCVQAQMSDGAQACEVVSIEDLGVRKVLTMKFEGQPIKAILAEDQTVPEQVAYIHFPQQWLKVYANEFLVDA